MTDLHQRLLAAIDAEEQTARNACAGPWSYDSQTGMVSAPHGRVVSPLFDADARHIAAQDPATTLRRLAEDRDVLARHAPVNERPYRKTKCRHDNTSGVTYVVDWPCDEILSLARRHGITP